MTEPTLTPPSEMSDEAKLALAREMFHAWDTKDWEGVIDLFADDGVLHSVMQEPLVGRDVVAERIRALGAITERITLHIKAIGIIDGKVFVQRVDDFDTVTGSHGEVPVVGILSMAGGRVTEWLEYYDRPSLLAGMGVDAPAH
ncbi:MAG TPA: nuclear transport factor 2 family protein [Humibacillus xanthopallidus]|nr:nuclear transport factor 2 family protein [Humibacillus xanthopallidus]